MSSFTFIHAADIHLDSPLRGLDRYEGAPVEEIRNATRRALVRLVDLAIEETVAFVVIAGDIYDGDWKDYNTGLFFLKQMARLREREVRVYLLAGNHDAASVLSRQLSLPDNVYRFSSRRPETFFVEDIEVALHGQSFGTRAVLENLSAAYPLASPDYFNIGVLHTSLTGREGHENYAPCSMSGLVAKGYDYWALGHVHNREVVSEDPWIVFPGNLQGRHIREQGAKGCTLVSVSDGEIVSVEARELDVLRWAQVSVSCSAADGVGDVADQAVEALRQEVEGNDGRITAARVVLSGACAAHAEISRGREHVTAEIRAAALSHFGDRLWIEKVVLNTKPAADWSRELQEGSPAADLLRLIDQVSSDDEEVASLIAQFADLQRRLPSELHGAGDDAGFTVPWMRDRLTEVKEEIVPRLLQDTK
jgi:DNA repair protein SbcD/Mre11